MKKPSPDQIKDILFSNAEDLGDAGIDNQTGHGRLTTDFIDCGRIMSDAAPSAPPSRVDNDMDGCRGIMAGLAVGALIWIVLLMLIHIGR